MLKGAILCFFTYSLIRKLWLSGKSETISRSEGDEPDLVGCLCLVSHNRNSPPFFKVLPLACDRFSPFLILFFIYLSDLVEIRLWKNSYDERSFITY